MDVASLSIAGVNFVMAGISMLAAEAAKECAKPAVQFAFDRLRERLRSIVKLPDREIDPELLRDTRIGGDEEVAKLTEEFIGHYSSIRRARIVASFLVGARILWVDDHPENNINEKRTLEDFGVQVDQVRSATEALEHFWDDPSTSFSQTWTGMAAATLDWSCFVRCDCRTAQYHWSFMWAKWT